MAIRKITKGSYFNAGTLGQKMLEAAAAANAKAKGGYLRVPAMILNWQPTK